jgi:hypothetical protein
MLQVLLLNKEIAVPRFTNQLVQYIQCILYSPGRNQEAKMLVLGFYLANIDHSKEIFLGCPNIKPREKADKLAARVPEQDRVSINR